MSGVYASAPGAAFDMGRVIRQTFGVIGRNAVSILLLGLAAAVANLALGWLLGTVVFTLFGYSTAAVVVGSALGIAARLVVQGLLSACLILIVIGDLNGRRTDVGTAFGSALRLAIPVVGLSLVMGFGIGLGVLLLIVPGVILMLRWFVAVPVRVVENVGLNDALVRSTSLTAGYRWSIFGLALAYVVLLLVVGLVIGALFGSDGMQRAAALASSPVGVVVNLAFAAVTSAIGSSGTANVYAELRRVKEGALPSQLAAVFE